VWDNGMVSECFGTSDAHFCNDVRIKILLYGEISELRCAWSSLECKRRGCEIVFTKVHNKELPSPDPIASPMISPVVCLEAVALV